MATYRLSAWMFTILWTYILTHKFLESAGFATILHFLLSFDYYIHERLWNKISWGLNKES